MWETPIYKFNQEVGDSDGDLVYKQVVIDVTRSAPSFATPGIALAGALDEAVAVTGVGPDDTILDFGAGKLRNTIYLLEKGYRVCAVEFAQQFESSQPARENLARAESQFADCFSRLVYPHAFEASEQRFKLILLINVINIMPVAAERDYVLTLCNQCLADDGRLLWYTQRGDQNYQKRLKKRFRLGDGVYVGRTTYHKTFYREYEVKDVDALLRRAGFDYDRKIEATWRNQSRLYKKTGPAVLAEVLGPKSIDHAQVSDDSIPDPKVVRAREPGRARKKYEPNEVTSAGEKRKGRPNPAQLTVEANLIEALKRHPKGDANAGSYRELIQKLFEHLFADALHKFRFVELLEGSAFKDLVAENKSKGGLFAALRQHDLVSLRIVVRCHNRRHVKADPAFDGLADGMDRNLRFGFLAYRGGAQRDVVARCRRYFLASNTPTAILPLDDGDLAKLLRVAGQGGNGIDGFLDERLREVTAPVEVFLSYSRDDIRMMNEVNKALATLKKRKVINLFVDRSAVKGGSVWQQEIASAVAKAEMAIFLVSNNSLDSEFIDPYEVDPLLEARLTRGVKIIPVLLSAADLPDKLAKLQFVNNREPIRDLSPGRRDEVWLEVVKEIKKAF
jgi:TIR domain-containing protein